VEDLTHPHVLFGPLVHHDAVQYGALSRDGRRLATACADGKVRVFDATTGADTGLVNDYGDALTAVVFSPDGGRIAYAGGTWTWAGSQDTSIRIWDLASGETKRLAGHSQAVYGLAWSPDGALLVSCGWDGQVKAWDPDSGRELRPFVACPGPPICRADFSPDGQLLGIVGADIPYPRARATLFDVQTRRVVRELAGHSKVVQGIRFSPDGQYVATSGLDGTVKVWPVNPPPAFVSLAGHSQAVWATAFSPDGGRVATGSLDQTARIWNATNGFLLRTLEVGFPVVSLAFSHDGERLATVGPENSACVWNASPKSEVRNSKFDAALLRLRGHTRAVLAVAWSPDDQWLATGGKDGTTRIWHATSGVERLVLAGHTGAVWTVAFAPDGKVLASGSADGTARLWSTHSGECLHVLTNHEGAVLSLAFSPKGRWLATGSSDKTARIWESDTGRPVHLLSAGHINGVGSLAFSPDGQRLATTAGGTNLQDLINRDGRIFFWDVASGHQLLVLLAHGNVIHGTAFSPDGRKLVTGGADNTARIWTAFPWRSADYPGATNLALATRIERYKREFWKTAIADHRAAAALDRPWTNGFGVYPHTFGLMNLPAAGSKTQPLFPIPPRPAQARPNHVDLGGAYNVALNECWQPIGNLADLDRSLAALPAGLQTFGGIPFDIRGIIQLRGGAPDAELFPARVAISVKRSFRLFHVLHGTTWTEREGCEIGAFVLHYPDGTVAEVPIRYGEHLRDNSAVADTRVDCPKARLAWGAESSLNPEEDRRRLYQATFPNPKSELGVVSIEFVSRVTRCGPFLVALTVE
jgi:WD40 repeat protein